MVWWPSLRLGVLCCSRRRDADRVDWDKIAGLCDGGCLLLLAMRIVPPTASGPPLCPRTARSRSARRHAGAAAGLCTAMSSAPQRPAPSRHPWTARPRAIAVLAPLPPGCCYRSGPSGSVSGQAPCTSGALCAVELILAPAVAVPSSSTWPTLGRVQQPRDTGSRRAACSPLIRPVRWPLCVRPRPHARVHRGRRAGTENAASYLSWPASGWAAAAHRVLVPRGSAGPGDGALLGFVAAATKESSAPSSGPGSA